MHNGWLVLKRHKHVTRHNNSNEEEEEEGEVGACLGEDETGGTEEVVFGRRRSVPVVKDEVKE